MQNLRISSNRRTLSPSSARGAAWLLLAFAASACTVTATPSDGDGGTGGGGGGSSSTGSTSTTGGQTTTTGGETTTGGTTTTTTGGSTTTSGGATSTSGGATSTSGGATSGGGTSSSSVTATTGGGPGADNDDTMDQASDYDVKEPTEVDADLSPVGDVDYYTFQGSAGQAVAFMTLSQELQNAAYDPTFPDLVLSLFDSAGKLIALNDDPEKGSSNDSRLTTILPADGAYYVRVEECHSYLANNPSVPGRCADPEDKPNTAYKFVAYDLSIDNTGTWLRDTEKGGDASNATTMSYVGVQGSPGRYYIEKLYGTFTSPTDVDVFAFTPPADAEIPSGRALAQFGLLLAGVPGNGSTTKPGKIYITTVADPSTRIAEIDGRLTDTLSPPIVKGTPYLLFVEHPGAAAGANDFYVLQHIVSGSNPLEGETPSSNDTFGTANLLTNTPDGKGAFIEGNLGSGDVDFFKVTIPAGLTPGSVLTAGCSAGLLGSGLTGLSLELLGSDGTSSLGSATENLTSTPPQPAGVYGPQVNGQFQGVTIPAGATHLYLKVSAQGQSAVTSDFYRCSVRFFAK